MMKIEFVDLKAQYESIKPEMDAAIADVITNSAFIGGKHLKAFESAFARYVGAEHCIGVGNGTDALYVALKALGIGPGDEVITAANSFIATSEAVTLTGAQVVFADCDPKTYTLDVGQVAAKITPRTRAIIPVHLYGHPADMDALTDLANRHGIKIVEDCAQSHGAGIRGKKTGTFGAMACFSFFPGKNLGAYGDAGAVMTNDSALSEKARMIANHGRIEKYNHEIEGINSRLDGMQAAILNVKLGHLETWTERRRAIAAIYNREFGALAATPQEAPGYRHVYHLYVLRVRDRARVQSALTEKGISTGIHYPIPLPFLKAYARLKHRPEEFPVSSRYKDEILSLPIHGNMRDEEVEYVVEHCKAALRAG
jgi:dTDP-4-amino-4,6-dideoxygalactose transaminase